MYKIIFYQNTNGENEVLNHINYLNQHTNKDNRIKLEKITAYMRLLQNNGLALGEPYICLLYTSVFLLYNVLRFSSSALKSIMPSLSSASSISKMCIRDRYYKHCFSIYIKHKTSFLNLMVSLLGIKLHLLLIRFL